MKNEYVLVFTYTVEGSLKSHGSEELSYKTGVFTITKFFGKDDIAKSDESVHKKAVSQIAAMQSIPYFKPNGVHFRDIVSVECFSLATQKKSKKLSNTIEENIFKRFHENK